MIPRYAHGDGWELYLGDCRDILPELGFFDCAVADPPYGETSLAWDRWPDGWPHVVATVTQSMWCFGSLRMLLDRADEFAGWHLSQDVVWEKPHGSGFAADRFRRVHEHVTHWYRGPWSDIHHEAPRETVSHQTKAPSSPSQPPHTGNITSAGLWEDDGTRLMRSVIKVASMWRRGIAPTEKPVALLDPLIRYACPPSGTVLDPFAGSGSTLEAARAAGRHAVGIEADEDMSEKAANRLSQAVLEVGV